MRVTETRAGPGATREKAGTPPDMPSAETTRLWPTVQSVPEGFFFRRALPPVVDTEVDGFDRVGAARCRQEKGEQRQSGPSKGKAYFEPLPRLIRHRTERRR